MEQLWIWELQIIQQLQLAPDFLIQFFKLVTSLVSENFYLILVPIFYWCIDMSIGYRLTIVLLIGNWSNTFFKMLLHLPRPFWLSSNIKAHVTETSFGLPSGHSTNASSIWLFLAKQYKHKKWLVILFVCIMLLIMISRLFLGMHFISDVLTGFLLGVILLVIIFWVDKKYAAKLEVLSLTKKILLSIATTIIFLLVGFFPIWINSFTLPAEWIERSILATGAAPDPFAAKGIVTLAGVWFSMNIGYSLLKETKHPLKTNGTSVQYLLRILIGLSGAMILRIGIKALYPPIESTALLYLLDFLRYAIMAFWIAYIAPIIFLKLNLYKTSV